ncbi:unnamed protein product, partial [Urochloa humidicola]
IPSAAILASRSNAGSGTEDHGPSVRGRAEELERANGHAAGSRDGVVERAAGGARPRPHAHPAELAHGREIGLDLAAQKEERGRLARTARRRDDKRV